MVFDLDPWGEGKIMSEVRIAILLYVLKLRDKVKNEEKTVKQISWKNVHRGRLGMPLCTCEWEETACVHISKPNECILRCLKHTVFT